MHDNIPPFYCKAFDLIISSAANTNHKNDLPTTVSVRLDKDNYLL